MIFFKRLLAAAILGAAGLFGASALLENPKIVIIIGIISIITGWNLPRDAADKTADKIVSATEDSLSGPNRNPLVTLLLWLVMFAILALGLIALAMFIKGLR